MRLSPDSEQVPPVSTPPILRRIASNKWFLAFKQVFPLYLALHFAALLTTWLSILFNHTQNPPLSFLLQTWGRWDTGWYLTIASRGYTSIWSTAFFPLYPLVVRGMLFLVPDLLSAGLLVSNLADLVLMAVFYQLVREDFGDERAQRAVLYLALFPTAFFLLAAYSESLYLCLALLCFYSLRRRHWWLAGIFGFLASLTRSAGLLLFVPFCYEYLRHSQFSLRKPCFHALSVVLLPLGTACYAAYCFLRFHNPLAFSYAEIYWHHFLATPWTGIILAFQEIARSPGALSYTCVRSLVDLVPDLLFLVLTILSFVGPWRFPREARAYALYAAVLFLFLHLFPIAGTMPLASLSRYVLEIFPAFLILAALGEKHTFHISWLLMAAAGFFVLLTLFLMRYWIV
ncbi:MAG TPA: glycosyltransferase family 39 protein [Ktedonobacteraceae bacterium]|nr:glycosyltransferase family 39 protein [Ktedonobacteraceae bacterium]